MDHSVVWPIERDWGHFQELIAADALHGPPLAGPKSPRAFVATLPCHLASGQSQLWRTIFRRMGVFAETVFAAAHESEEIALPL